MMNFFKKKIAIGWAVVLAVLSAIPWLLLFLFGTGAYWEYNKMPLVTLEIAHKLAELHQKKAAAFEEVLRLEMAQAPRDSPIWKAKVDYLNAIENSIAQLEGRKPAVYARLNTSLSDTLS